jgi:hypothetical protein
MSQAAPALSMLLGRTSLGVTNNYVGPGLSGLLLSYFDLNVIFLIEFVTFLVAVIATKSTVIPRPPKGKEDKGSVKKEVMTALGYIWERKGLFTLLCFSSLGKFPLPPRNVSLTCRSFFKRTESSVIYPTYLKFFPSKCCGKCAHNLRYRSSLWFFHSQCMGRSPTQDLRSFRSFFPPRWKNYFILFAEISRNSLCFFWSVGECLLYFFCWIFVYVIDTLPEGM